MATPSKNPYGICPFCGSPLRLSKSERIVFCGQLRWITNEEGELEASGPCQFRFMTPYNGMIAPKETYPYLAMGGQVTWKDAWKVRLYYHDGYHCFVIRSMKYKGTPLKGDANNVGLLDFTGKLDLKGVKFGAPNS